MKAICNGDREVGKMLYSMVTLFRSQLKETDIITLGQELDYCKQYLELFEYQYKGIFRSEKFPVSQNFYPYRFSNLSFSLLWRITLFMA